MTALRQEQFAAIYVRVSSGEQVENTSLEEQARRCDLVAAGRDRLRPVVYREEDVSGTTADRPAWKQLMKDCRAGRVSKVYALNWKRLARNAQVGLQIATELEQLGVGLVVVEADFDTTTPTGKIMRHMMVGFAAFDRDSIVEQMARGQHAMAARGFWPSGGASPYGYRATGGSRTNTLVIEHEEANTIRLIGSWIVDEHQTTGEVCRRLNAAGTFTRHGKQWTHSNLRRILRQRVLVGEIIWGNTEKTHRSYVPSGKYGPPVVLKFEPILTEEQYAALQVALDSRATGKRASNKPYPLSGRLFSPCGEPYGGVYRKDRDTRQYRCRARQWKATGELRCTDPLLMAEDLEARVWAEVTALLGDKQRLLAMAQDYLGLRELQVDVEHDEVAALEARIQRLQRAQRDTLVDLARRGFEADAIEEAQVAVQRELDAARARLAEVTSWSADSSAEARRGHLRVRPG